MVVIKVIMAASRHLDLLEFHNDKTTEFKHFKLCTGKPYCYVRRPTKRHCAILVILFKKRPIFWDVMREQS
jgi:hypothetical protein